MNTILQTQEFQEWLMALGDLVARAKILVRIERAALGNFGDVAPVGNGVAALPSDDGRGRASVRGHVLSVLR